MAKNKLLFSNLGGGEVADTYSLMCLFSWCLFVSSARLQGWICMPFIWVSSPMQKASYQIVTRSLFPQHPSHGKTEAPNWANWKGCRPSPDPLGCILGGMWGMCALILVLVTTYRGLHPDGVCFLLFIYFYPWLTLNLFLFFVSERINYFYMFSVF